MRSAAEDQRISDGLDLKMRLINIAEAQHVQVHSVWEYCICIPQHCATTAEMAGFLISVISVAALASAFNIPRVDNGGGIMKLPITRANRTDTPVKRQIDTGLANPEYGTIYIVNSTLLKINFCR